VTVVHHVDADGVSAAAVAATCLTRAGIAHRLMAVKSLDDHHIRMVQAASPHALWFCDLGSAAYARFAPTPRLVCDHHELVRDGTEESFPHVNPLLDGLRGDELSGAGCAYLVAAALGDNEDLLPLALVGATGDLQDRRTGRFEGTNRVLLRQAQERGLLAAAPDLAFFGPQTRPLSKFLHLAADPEIPGLTRNARGVQDWLASNGLGDLDATKPWAMQSEGDRARLRSALAQHLVALGLADRVPRLFRDVVTLVLERPGQPTRELQEFATLLNSTARYGREEVGLAVAQGDRGDAYGQALDLLQDHRRHLAGSLEALKATGMQRLGHLQWVHAEDRVRDTVIGIVCGMAQEALSLPRDLVVVGLAWTPDGRTKASARATAELQGRGVDLALAMRTASEGVGGNGGGHKGAAGATIPRDAEAEFLRRLDAILGSQGAPRSEANTNIAY
jgi:single-stranded-DNA-specific exonuclease